MVNAIKGNNYCLPWELYEPHKHTVNKLQDFLLCFKRVPWFLGIHMLNSHCPCHPTAFHWCLSLNKHKNNFHGYENPRICCNMAIFCLSLLVVCIIYLKHTNRQASARITSAIQDKNYNYLYYKNSLTVITIHNTGHMHYLSILIIHHSSIKNCT
jgi:hypothetical protein